VCVRCLQSVYNLSAICLQSVCNLSAMFDPVYRKGAQFCDRKEQVCVLSLRLLLRITTVAANYQKWEFRRNQNSIKFLDILYFL
jgi:hypothetical protein